MVWAGQHYLPSIVGAVPGEDAVDLRLLDGAEHQRLPVVPGPVVQAPHPDAGEVDAVGVQRLQVHVLHHVLHEGRGSGEVRGPSVKVRRCGTGALSGAHTTLHEDVVL